MSITVPTTTSTTTTEVTAPRVGALLLTGAAATVGAAAAASAVAAAGRLLGVGTEVGGQPIPTSGFAVLTVVFSVVGLLVAVALRRFTRRPRTAWLRTTAVLTVLSFLPDLLVDATTATRVLLILTHLAAAAVVVPAVARRLA